jgi:hypothetical protein
VWKCVCVGFVMCVCVGFVMCVCVCVCFGKMCTCIYCVLYCFYCVFCIVSFMYIYSYPFCLYWCKDYCQGVTTQLQLVVVVVVVVVVVIPYCKYTPANVLKNENFKLYRNRSILTDKTIPFNRPGTTFMNKKTKEHLFDRHSCHKYTQSRQNSNR